MTTIIRADELHSVLKKWMPLNRHDDLAKCFVTESPASNTHNLRPLPESEWPEEFRWVREEAGYELVQYFGKLTTNRHLVRSGKKDINGGMDWDIRKDDGTLVESEESPAAALEAAGLPVELLEGLKRPTPAHENPRVVAAAVEMVKEVEQHKAKAAKDREDWLAQFPGWVRNWCEANGANPIYFDPSPPHVAELFHCFVLSSSGFHFQRIRRLAEWDKPCQFMSATKTYGELRHPTIGRYADGNVPLWGDEVEYESGNRYRVTNINRLGDFVFDNGQAADSSRNTGKYRLIRRHPAIADLPGIVVENDLKVPGVNCPEPEYDPDDVAFKADKSTIVVNKYSGFVADTPSIGDEWALIDGPVGGKVASIDGDCIVDEGGMRRRIADVRIVRRADKSDTESPDRSTDRPAPKLRVGMRVRCDQGIEWFVQSIGSDWAWCWSDLLELRRRNPLHVLTPIPPPLTDNGDGTWTLEGCRMFKLTDMADGNWVWCWAEPHGGIALSRGHRTKEAAAEDLWRRMEGI